MGGRAGEATVFPAEGPAGFDPAHPYADPAAVFAQREHIVREKLVKVETAKARRRARCAALLRRSAAPARLCMHSRLSGLFGVAPEAHSRFGPAPRSCASAFRSATARRA